MKTTISIERNAENISYTITKVGHTFDVSKTINGDGKPATFVFDNFQDALDWVRDRLTVRDRLADKTDKNDFDYDSGVKS